MTETVISGLRGFRDFSGTMSRAAFWQFYLFAALLHSAATLVDGLARGKTFGFFVTRITTETVLGLGAAGFTSLVRPLPAVCLIFLFLPLLAAGCRRMNDSGRSPFLNVAAVGVSVCIYLAWFIAVGRYGPGSALVVAYGSLARVLLSKWLLPVQLLASLVCLWLLTRPSREALHVPCVV